MACCTNAIRIAVIRREVRMVECRSGPSGGGVARGAGRGEAGGRMVRVRRTVIVRLMAAHAGRWQCRVVVIYVAHHTGHGGRGVEAG